MRKLIHLLLILAILAGGIGVTSSPVVAHAAHMDDLLDLADVPLPVQQLPEDGYQVLTGAYLSPADIVSLIANPRNLGPDHVAGTVGEIGVSRAYVLDLVLPEDRAYENSPVLAVQQSSVYLLDDEDPGGEFTDLLTDYSSTAYVDEKDPAVPGAYTVSTAGESGDLLRTVVQDGRVVIEVVSMDTTGIPDETAHMQIVEATLLRLNTVRARDDLGLSSTAMTLSSGSDSVPFVHTQQSGVHGLYRLRDGEVQPAAGESNRGEVTLPSGIQSLYLSSTSSYTQGGQAFVSLWLASFDTPESATQYFGSLLLNASTNELVDPYFHIGVGETWTEQGIVGLFRVAGTFEGARYSGSLEIRVQGDTVAVVGYRSVGAVLPDADIKSQLMDHQLDCLAVNQICAPFDLPAPLPPAQATPIATGSEPGSNEFGWKLPELGPDWIVTEQISEPGYDRIGLRNGLSLFEFESVINHHGDPEQCVLDELQMLEEFEQHAGIRLWLDPSGNTVGGSNTHSAWIAYQVEPLEDVRADQEYVIRIDCYPLELGNSNLVMTQTAPADAWIEESGKGDLLREGLFVPVAFAAHDRLWLSVHDRRTNMIYVHWVDQTV